MTKTAGQTVHKAPLAGLSATASTKERITALLDLGVPSSELRNALAISEATIRNWLDGSTSPRESALRALDDLRTVVVVLHEADVTGDRAVAWLTSRQLDTWLRGRRPIDVLRSDPIAVLASAEELLLPSEEGEAAPIVHLDMRPRKKRADPSGHATPKSKSTRRRRSPAR